MSFKLHAPYQPAGDQPDAIDQLTEGIFQGEKYQTLLGVTGSGKTFTIANVIQNVQRPTLVLTHNKTLVAQLYGEFKQFFPENAVGYFVSYYDYYQPEAYMPVSDVYIEKDLSINEELYKLRLQATAQLLSGRRDIIVVASVSCIYGIGNPADFENGIVRINKNQTISRQGFLHSLVNSLYNRTTLEFKRGTFRVKGDTVEINLPYVDYGYRIIFFGDEIEEIESFDVVTGRRIGVMENAAIFPANLYLAPKDMLQQIIYEIQDEMQAQVEYFKSVGKFIEAQRLKERVEFDVEMIRELGYCNGIENYSRFFDRRYPGTRPFCLLDYFPKDFLCVIDESHQTVPQVSGMYGGDRSRKLILVDYGFRLPSALDNRPLTFDEFEARLDQTIFVSATPGPYEKEHAAQTVEQIIRPTGLVDPEIEVRPTDKQIDDLLAEIRTRAERGQRAIVTTLTKKMAEDLADYLREMGVKVQYLHSEIETIERVEILRDLRLGVFDVVVGVNLLREGIDLPEVTLVAILDADKEGYLRSEGSLIQVIGRAARHLEGRVIMYADRMTASMRAAIDETERRREVQLAFNKEHGIDPQTVVKAIRDVGMRLRQVADVESVYEKGGRPIAAGELPRDELARLTKDLELQMKTAATELAFEKAAALRDEIVDLRGLLVLQSGPEGLDDSAMPTGPRTTQRVMGRRRGS